MSKEEKLIVSAYTGYLMVDFDDLHKYINEKLGRPVFTHELCGKTFDELHEIVKDDFLRLCDDKED